jgi:hypothetical protein
MLWLLDADMLLKLGRLGLIPFFEQFTKEKGIELRWLGSAYFTLGLHNPTGAKTLRRCGRPTVVQAISDFCAKHKKIELAVADLDQKARDLLVKLTSTWDIDEGEALIFVAAIHCGAHVVTDDGRSIQALTSETGFHDVRAALAKKWVSLLQVVRALIDRFGFEPIKSQVIGDLACDTAVRSIFGSGPAATLENVRAGLAHYISDQQKKHAELFYPISS